MPPPSFPNKTNFHQTAVTHQPRDHVASCFKAEQSWWDWKVTANTKSEGESRSSTRHCKVLSGWVFHLHGGGMRYPTAESDVLPWKEQWSRQTADTPNTPSSSYNAWKHPSACCKETKCFNPLMWGKGLLSSTVRGFCLHEISAVWISKRSGVAFIVLCFSRWADALSTPNRRREGSSSCKMTLGEGESGIKLKLAITSGNCSAGVWAGRWKPHGKALERPKLTFQYLHSKTTLETGLVICELLDPWEELLCCQLWLISAVVAYLCSASTPMHPGLELQQDTEIRLETPVQPMASDWSRHWSHAQTSTLLSRITSLIPHSAGYWTNRSNH